MANYYEKGETVRITGTFTVSDVATDPTTVTLKVQNPAGTETTYTYAAGEITKSATGVASPRAQGHAITRSATAARMES